MSVTNSVPSPLEVYRFISARYGKTAQSASLAFPSPREVHRFISTDKTYLDEVSS